MGAEMTKADIIDRVCERVGGFSKKEAADLVEKVFDVMKCTLETGEKRRLTAPPADHFGDVYPQFSPDGRTVAFARQKSYVQSSQSGIYLVPAEGGEPRPLVTGNHFTIGLDWTPDGREITGHVVNSRGNLGSIRMQRIA